MSYSKIILEKIDGVAILKLNNPAKLNCLNDSMIKEIIQALQEIEKDDSIGSVVLTGEGKAFCAGGDINEMIAKKKTAVSGYEHMNQYHHMTVALTNLEKPVIAAVNGIAVGGGFSLVFLCDVIISSDKAKFRSVFQNIALVPDLSIIYNLTKAIGPYKLKELIFSDRLIDSEEAKSMGLVNRVVPSEELLKEALELAKKLANGPRVMLRYTKKMVNMARDNNMLTMLELEARIQTELFLTQDHKIAADAFVNKEKPIFTGK